MQDTAQPLKPGEGGPYGELSARPLLAGLTLLFMPALAALLEGAERIKGAPLTQEEVARIRNAALVVVTPVDVASAVVQGRGYAEVDPGQAWENWQAIRGK